MRTRSSSVRREDQWGATGIGGSRAERRGQETALTKPRRRPTLFDPATYAIRIRGVLAPTWSDQMGGMHITVTQAGDDAITELVGRLADQADLHGVLAGLYELGFPMLSVEYVPSPVDGSVRE